MNKIFILLICNIFSVYLINAEGIKDSLIVGKLNNGLTYYLRHQVPTEYYKDRVSFYIIQNVGSLMEEDFQNGLAYFLEHMALNGTEHFKTVRKALQNPISMALFFDEFESLTTWQKKGCLKLAQKYYSDTGMNWQLKH